MAPKVNSSINADQWVSTGQWVGVTSSNVKGIAYDSLAMELKVEFKGGSVYAYYNVGDVTAKDMFNTNSMGKFVHARLKGKYQYKKI